ncbi:MAG: phospho-N-acetylmuramoyl-pentapeptide-transferase, phospho-N-acetylmuramoyl-pentapeptide-transferase, partial [Candidatus Parcubacteria bacterium]
MPFEPLEMVKVFIPTTVAFIVGIMATPLLTHYLYQHRVWKKVPGKIALDGNAAHEFNKLHLEREGKTPRMGGILIWASILITTLFLVVIDECLTTHSALSGVSMFSRSQTLIPLAVLIIGALVGFMNDYY